MFAQITLDRNMTPAQIAASCEAKPRSMRRLAGGYIADIVALCKSLILCPECRPKFDARAYSYVQRAAIPFVQGRCDGCRQPHGRAHFLVHASQIPR